MKRTYRIIFRNINWTGEPSINTDANILYDFYSYNGLLILFFVYEKDFR